MNTTYDEILLTGVRLWREKMQAPSVRGVAAALNLTHPAVLYYCKNAAGLRKALADQAVKMGDMTLIPLLIVTNDPSVAHFTDEQRRAYLPS